MNYRTHLAELLEKTLSQPPFEVDVPLANIEGWIEVPKDSSLGDLAFPCFHFAKTLRRAPPQIAAEVEKAFVPSEGVSEAKATGPYVNFRINKTELAGTLLPAVLDGSYLAPRPRQADKIMVEYSQPNTHKAMHVGHARCAALGDSLVRMFEWGGHEVVAANYIGDEGTHVARCLWYYQNVFDGNPPEQNRGEFLGEQYVQATDWLDLGTLTRAPMPGVTTARVLDVETHSKENAWTVVQLETVDGERTVVCGGKGFAAGDRVAYVKPGLRVGGRAVGEIDKKGVLSVGMIASEAELGLSDDKEQIAVLSGSSQIGDEVAELYKTAEYPSVLAEFERRSREVGQVLQRLEGQEPEIHALWKETKQWSMDEFYAIYAWLNCRFDTWFYESEFGDISKRVVHEYLEKGVFVKSEGAVGADLSADKLGFCLLIKTNGTATYASRDISLATEKFDRFGVDRSVYVVDSAQSLHFQQVFKCLEKMGYEQAMKCHHHAYAQVVLRGADGEPVKMSSRKGNVILFSQLRSGLVDIIREKFLERYRGEWPEDEIDAAGRAIALATIRYGMLKQDGDSLILFDLDEWTDPKGNTGAYFLYAYSRIRSILKRAGEPDLGQADWSLLSVQAEAEVILALEKYPDVVARATERFAPNAICSFLYDLAKKYNGMNRECSVLHAETDALRHARAALHDAVSRVLKHGLGLLGIETIARM
jgi:arginyl-tRNA synthetase